MPCQNKHRCKTPDEDKREKNPDQRLCEARKHSTPGTDLVRGRQNMLVVLFYRRSFFGQVWYLLILRAFYKPTPPVAVYPTMYILQDLFEGERRSPEREG